MLLAALWVTTAVGILILKPSFARPRPFNFNPSVKIPIELPRDFSFPSGHTASAFAATAVLLVFNKKAGIVAFLTAALIAFSRLYLYVHYPTDVLGGMILGMVCGKCVNFVFSSLAHTRS